MNYYFDDNRIKPCYLVNDIGVDIHRCRPYRCQGLFSYRILFRGFVSRQAYITYIRTLLENASNVWSPHLITHINSLERVQRHFTTRIIELQDLSYQERLTVFNLETLEYRRLHVV